MKDYAPQGTSDKFPPLKVLLSTLSDEFTVDAFFLMLERRSDDARNLNDSATTTINIGPIQMRIDFDGYRGDNQPRHPHMFHCGGSSNNLQTNNRPFTHESASIRLQEIISLISRSEKMVAKVVPSACVDYLGHAHLQCEESGRILGSTRILFAFMLYDMIRSEVERKSFYLSNDAFDIFLHDCLDDRGIMFEITDNTSGDYEQIDYSVFNKDTFDAGSVSYVANTIYKFITSRKFWGE